MKRRILLVEDDLNARIALACWLEQAGYEVVQSHDGETAFELLETEIFDVVLTDILMGEIDGIEVLQVARSLTYRPEVIILTGHGSLDTAIRAIRAGAYDYLLKPFDEDELLNRVESAVKQHNTEQQRQTVEQQLLDTAALLSRIYDGNKKSQRNFIPYIPSPKDTSASLLQPIQIGALSIGNTRHEVTFSGKFIKLTPIEYALLRCLAEKPGVALSYREIVRRTHRFDAEDTDAQMLVKQHIFNVRKKIDPSYLLNDRGKGYMLINPEMLAQKNE